MHAQRSKSVRYVCGCVCVVFAYAFVVFLVFAELCNVLDVFNTWFITYIKLGCVQMNSENKKLK